MSGFDTKVSDIKPGVSVPEAETGIPVLDHAEINACVARAAAIRSAHLGLLLRRGWLTLSSLWRRPGRLVPRDYHHRRAAGASL